MTVEILVDLDPFTLANQTEPPQLYQHNSTQPLVRLVQAIHLYLIPVISGIGLAGGACSFLVLMFTTFRYQPCSHYLAVLTISDTGFLVALLIAWLMSLYPSLAITPGICQVIVYLTYTCSFLSAWYLVLLMVERYIVVCYPLHAPVLCTKRNTRIAIVVTTLIALLLYVHSFFTTHSIIRPFHAPCAQNEKYLNFLAIFSYADSLVTFALPFTTILVLNVRIILVVRNFRRRHLPLPIQTNRESPPSLHSKLRSHHAQHVQHVQHVPTCVMSQAQVRATKLLVWVASVFLVLYLPSHALRLYILIRMLMEGPVYSDELMLVQQICQFFYYINFAVDFFVFSVTSKSFRRNIARCLRRLQCRD